LPIAEFICIERAPIRNRVEKLLESESRQRRGEAPSARDDRDEI